MPGILGIIAGAKKNTGCVSSLEATLPSPLVHCRHQPKVPPPLPPHTLQAPTQSTPSPPPFVVYFANVWNEREADNVRERRDFEDDKLKSHIRLSSAQPFSWSI